MQLPVPYDFDPVYAGKINWLRAEFRDSGMRYVYRSYKNRN